MARLHGLLGPVYLLTVLTVAVLAGRGRRTREPCGRWAACSVWRPTWPGRTRVGPAVVGVSVRVMSFERPGSHNLYRDDEV